MQHWCTVCHGRNAQWLRGFSKTANSHISVFHSIVRHAYDPPLPDPLAISHSSQKLLKHTVFRLLPVSVFCRNFCNICHTLLQRCICCEITFQKIIRFVCFPVSFRDFIGFPLRFLANSIACTLYSSSYSLFFDIFLSSVFPFFYFIPLWLTCQVLLYRISLLCFYYDFVEMIQLS